MLLLLLFTLRNFESWICKEIFFLIFAKQYLFSFSEAAGPREKYEAAFLTIFVLKNTTALLYFFVKDSKQETAGATV